MKATLALITAILAPGITIVIWLQPIKGAFKPSTQEEVDAKHLKRILDQSQVITIDGCQYIYMERGSDPRYGIALTHKGNCTNHIAAH